MSPQPSGRPPGGVERRRSPRADPDELAETVSVIGSHVVNISRDGMLMEAPVPLPPDSSLRFRIVVGGVKAEVRGRVARCRPRAPAGGRWRIGVEFLEVPGALRERLARALGTWRVRPRSA